LFPMKRDRTDTDTSPVVTTTNESDLNKPGQSKTKTPITQTRVQIFVKCPFGKTVTVEMPSQTTIRTLKHPDSLLTTIPTREFYMVYGDEDLTKQRTLPSYDIKNMSTVFMRLRCKDGGPSLNDSSWIGTTTTNPTTLTTYLETKQATQGNKQGLWKDENVSVRYGTELDSNKTKENRDLSSDELTRHILDHIFQPMIQPNGVGGYGDIFPQSNIEREDTCADHASGEDFTTTL
jgi:hypothetical protein